MKNILILLIPVFLLANINCSDEITNPCKVLNDGLVNYDVEKVKQEIDEMLDDLFPSPIAGDEIGHHNNLETLVERLQTECGYEVEIVCYACVYTFPPQSEIVIELNPGV